MNVKRHLKQQAQTDLQTIKDSDNGNTLKTLGVEYPTQQPKKRQTWSKWLFASMGAVLSLALVLCVVFLLPSQNTEPIYLEENEERIESNIDEANKSAHDFFLNIDESLYSIQTRKTVDKITGDVLCYTVNLDSYDTVYQIEIVIVCNPRYHYSQFEFPITPITAEIENFKLLYHSIESEPDPQFGLTYLSCLAEITGKTDTIYFTKYQEMLLTPDGTFLQMVQELVQPATK